MVLVTTKQGKIGKTKLNIASYYGLNITARQPQRLNSWDEQVLIDEARFNATGAKEYNDEQERGNAIVTESARLDTALTTQLIANTGSRLEVAIAALGAEGAIHHTHAKDTAINPANAALNGVLDTTPLSDVRHRSWIFRTVGYGHGELDWRRILSALRLAGYDDVLSIEHEDALLSIDEGFKKGVAFLRSVMPREPALSDAWWT